MKISFAAVIAAALTLSGCVTLPKGGALPVSVSDIFAAVRCDISSALSENPNRAALVKGWSGAATLSVTLTNSASATPGLTFKTTQVVTLSANPTAAGATGDSAGATFAQPVPLDTSGLKDCMADARSDRVSRLDFGLWLDRVIAINDGPKSSLAELDYGRTFSVTRTVTGGLSFTIYGVDVGLDSNTLSRADSYSLDLKMAPPEPAKPKGKPKGQPQSKPLEDPSKRVEDLQNYTLLLNG